jgi:signal transduction histidine kinase
MESAARRWPALVPDVLPVLGLLGLAALTKSFDRGLNPVIPLLVIVPPIARRVWPFPVLILVAGIAVATSTDTPSPWTQVGAVALASFSTGEMARDRPRSAVAVIVLAGLMTLGFLAQDADPFQSMLLPFVIVVPSWLLGDVTRARRVEAIERAAEATRAARDAEERVIAAAAGERRHMARELHDVVAHGVSVMLVQAGAARQVLQTSPERAEDALLTVEATGREAMAELRRMLGVLNDDGEATGLTPQPGVDQLEALISRVREAGLPTELEIDGTPRTLPASLDVTVYRIVQEALTNALRYARRAATLVHLSYEPAQIRVEVLDEGPATADALSGSGRGLIGMEQRASLVGGRVEAGPRLGGGYAVRAWLPLDPERP